MHKTTVLAVLAGFMLVSSFAFSGANAQAKKGPNVDEIRFIHYEDENVALQQVRTGELDAYFFKIPLEVADEIKSDQRIKIYTKLSGSNTLLFNPAPSKVEGILNPFQLREVRFAINYLIDREYVVNEFHKGYGNPMVDPFGIYSPEYFNVVDTVESFGIRHNPELAEKMITEAMMAEGASKKDGVWIYDGKPVTIKILIRLDDTPRKLIGEDLASRLESVGFTVEKEYGDLNKANAIVYGTDPQEFGWHVYTEGFGGTSVFVKYNPTVLPQMYSPWFGRMPGWGNEAFWNYQNAELDSMTQAIFFAEFKSEQERTELVNKATELGINEAVRLFVNQKEDPYVAGSSVTGLVNDFGAGITSKYSAANVRPGSGSSLDIGVKQIHQGAWNSVGGYQDIYSKDIFYTVIDLGTFRDPYSGDIIPMRTDWKKVTTKGPDGEVKVTSSAKIWDPEVSKWKSVGKGANATSKVTYKTLYSNWHNGIQMDKTDLLYPYYFLFEWGTCSGDDDVTCDPEYESQAAPAIPRAKGIKFTKTGYTNYVDFWHYDRKEIADYASTWATEPWEITAATERLVSSGEVAYSRAEATLKNVPWLDLIVPEHAEMVRKELQKMKDEGYIPPALKGMVSESKANELYDASIKWIDEHKHAIIGNGPFYLDSYNIAGRTITIKAFRDSSYPFDAGKWSIYEKPKLATITKADVPRTIEIGKQATATVTLTVDGKPSNDAQVTYFITDKSGKIVAKGSALPGATIGTFTIEISADDSAKLSVGPNELKIFANGKEAFRPDIATATIIAK